ASTGSRRTRCGRCSSGTSPSSSRRSKAWRTHSRPGSGPAPPRALGRSPRDLKRIAITHGHRSHLGGLAALKHASGATVYAHEWEADIIGGDRRAQAVSLLPKQSLKLLPSQLGLFLGRRNTVTCRVDKLLDE